MNVNNHLQGLQQLFSSQEVTPPGTGRTGAATGSTQEGGDQATLSTAASLAAQSAPDTDVRMEKVTAVQQALEAGTYNVPSAAVASRMIDAMLGKS